MKSRGEVVIIMLQWMRLYTLGSRGSRELKTFLETRLISSRVDQKLSFKGRNTLVLKRKLGSKSWVMEAIIEAFCKGRGSGSTWRGRGFNSAMILTGFNGETASNFFHDRTMMGSRSRRDRATIMRRS